MRVTKEQLAQWGAKGLKVIEAKSRRSGYTESMPAMVIKETMKPKKPKMNKTERAYALQLEALKQTGAITHYGFEEITLVLDDPSGGRKTRYTPDFFVVRKVEMINFATHWLFEFHEVKGGYIWEDAKMKFKWARKQHPWFKFKMMQYIKGVWNEILLP